MPTHALPFVILGLLTLVALVAIASAIGASRMKERARSGSFQSLAAELALAYEPKAPRDFRDAWAVLPEIPKQGDIQHLLYGAHGDAPITAFRHRYVVSTGHSAVTIVNWVFSTEVPNWPEIHLKPRAFLARTLGKRSNVVLDDLRFDGRWVVKAPDRAFARDQSRR